MTGLLQEFDKLFDDLYCSNYMVDFLEPVRANVLCVISEERRECTKIVKTLQEFYTDLQKYSSYSFSRAISHRIGRSWTRS